MDRQMGRWKGRDKMDGKRCRQTGDRRVRGDVICSCIINYPKIQWLKTTIVFSISVGQESEFSLPECLCLKMSHKASMCWLGLQSHLKAQPREGPLPKSLNMVVARIWSLMGCWTEAIGYLLAVCQAHPWFLTSWPSLQGSSEPGRLPPSQQTSDRL